jgi:WD40 repeat protein
MHLIWLRTTVTQGPSCRCVLFSNSMNIDSTTNNENDSCTLGGQHLFTACNGGSLRCLDSELACSLDPSHHDSAILWPVDNAHHVGICKLYQLPQSSPAGPLLVSGDDAGAVRLWDTRTCAGDGQCNINHNTKPNPFDSLMKPPRGCVMQWKVNHDYITDFACNNDGSHLLATSADGTLTIFDVRFVNRKHTPRSVILPQLDSNPQPQPSKSNTWEKSGYIQSDNQDDELLSLCLIKNSSKVLCTSQQGILSLFSYGTWGDISDRFPGHPQSVDALLKIDEDTVLTGSSDGLVRAVQLLPNALLGVLGSHEGFPVEALGWSAGRKMVGSLSHDEFIRLWDGSFLRDDEEEDSEQDMDEDGDEKKPAGKVAGTKEDDSDGWEDLDEDEEMDDSNDSDSDSDDSQDGGTKPNKRPNIFKCANEEFFQDL